MDTKLKKKVERLLLNAALVNTSTNNYHRTDSFPGGVAGLITDEPEVWEISNEHSILLIKLSQQLSLNEQEHLDDFLLEQIRKNLYEQSINTIALYFIHVGKVIPLTTYLESIINSYENDGEGLIYAIEVVKDAIKHRPDLFTEEQGEHIDRWIDETLSGKSPLATKVKGRFMLYESLVRSLHGLQTTINELLTQAFAREINSTFNPELNIDEEKVHEAIDDLGLNLDLSISLKHIASEIQSANTELNYRDIMSSLRAYTERFYEQIAKKIDPATDINGKDSKRAAKFFKEQKLISADVAELLEAHRHFLSNDGTHRIKSRKEDLRIAKNFTIEISLYLLTRLRESNVDKSDTN